MKKLTTACMALLIVLSSCTTGQGAVSGASLGGMFGSALGGILGGPYGRDLGTMVGMVAGGATGATIGYQSEKRRYEQEMGQYNQRASERQARAEARSREETRVTIPVETEAPQSMLTMRNLRFIGEDGNQAINRNETCKIIFELANLSGQTVYNVVPEVTEINGNSHITISPTTRIESINNGDAIRYTAIVTADRKLKEGTAAFRIAVSTDGQEFITLKEFSIATAE